MNHTFSGDSTSQEIDAIVQTPGDWRGETLARLRAIIVQADPAISEEVKWKKPSKPQGIPVWVHEGNVCMADTLKNAVRLTFPKGAKLNDKTNLFNARLEGDSIRAIDFYEGTAIDETALTALVQEAARLNTSTTR